MPALPCRIILSLALAFGLAACQVPQGAPEAQRILSEANDEEASFAVKYINRDTVDTIKRWPLTGKSNNRGWIKRSRGPGDQLIEAGDMVDITVWDNEPNSLLIAPSQKVVSLKDMRVSQRGTVFMPYVDEIYIAKMTPDRARQTIQERMATIIPSAQVQLSHVSGRKSTVDLVSGAQRPGNYPLPDRDFTVTALIAMGGGIPENINNPQIRLMREGKLYGVAMETLLETPSLDTTLRGGDKVYVEKDERYFLALGAAGREAQISFPQEQINALDAMSLIGGVNDNRADPKGILILRNYSANALRSDDSGPSHERMVFAIDLTSGDGLFSAGEFAIHDRDLVLVTESALTTTETVMRLIGAALGVRARL